SGAFFQDANLEGANLKNADLFAVNMNNANLKGTNMNASRIMDATFINAIFDKNTIWPEGFSPLKAGAKYVD
ncbi:pentapeptide repeat-containing protein, partial [Providencia stuartii]